MSSMLDAMKTNLKQSIK